MLDFDKPEDQESDGQMHALIMARFKTIPESENYILRNGSYPIRILPFKDNGQYLVGKIFLSKRSAENEFNRFVNMGVRENSIDIIPF